MKPLVSVILPARNAGHWLQEAVASILAQSLTEFELIVVDDHSDDDCVARLSVSDPRLRTIKSAGRGVSRAFNTGFACAQGDYVARMDADDIALPRRLEMQLAYLEQHPEVALCGGCVDIFIDDGAEGVKPAAGNRRYQDWLNACRSPAAIRRELFIESPIPNPTALFRRNALAALRGYAETDWPEDYDLFLRADRCGMSMGKPDGIVLRWREHGKRLTRVHPRYSRACFQAAKAHYLVRGRLASLGPVVIWGAGPGGRQMHDLLQREGQEVSAFLDVHPRRIGGEKRGLPVLAIDRIDELSDRYILVAVGAVGARPRIRSFMDRAGRSEGHDYLFVA